MSTCPECKAEVTVGAIFCDECGAFLLDVSENTSAPEPLLDEPLLDEQPAARPVVSFDNQTAVPGDLMPFADDTEMTPPPSLLGQAMETNVEAQRISFVIPSSGRRIELALDKAIDIGRADPQEKYFPGLDLTEDQGAELGVSRRHATIERTNRGVLLLDLNSTNGTKLNNFRVPPELPYPLHNGDEIRLGRLLVHVFIS